MPNADRSPQARTQQFAQRQRLGGDALGIEPAAGIDLIAAHFAGEKALLVLVIVVQRPPVLQRRQQHFLVFLGDGLVQRFLLGGFGQQFSDMAVEIRLDVAEALRLAAKRLGRMDIGVVVDLGEGLQRDIEPVDVMQDALVVIGQPPGAGIDILAGIELDMLGGAAQFGVGVAAIKRPVPPPERLLYSSTVTLYPASRNSIAATMPEMPAPSTSTEVPAGGGDSLIGPLKVDSPA